eukprot:11163229-Lingulodinium_polyedra.AAC.1
MGRSRTPPRRRPPRRPTPARGSPADPQRCAWRQPGAARRAPIPWAVIRGACRGSRPLGGGSAPGWRRVPRGR